jgi:hypothetical protein
MEDNLNFKVNGDNLNCLEKWETTSMFVKMGDNLNVWKNCRQPQFYGNTEDDLIFGKIEDDLIFCKMEDYLYFKGERRRHQFLSKWKMTSISR